MITISMHDKICNTINCPHYEDCYFIAREKHNETLPHSITEEILNKCNSGEAIVYASLCDKECAVSLLTMAMMVNNFNVTLNYNVFKAHEKLCANIMNRLQITIYHQSQILELKEAQKLFFVKDLETLKQATLIIKSNMHNIHFTIKRDYFDMPQLLAFGYMINQAHKSVTMDSCLEYAIVNQRCIYANNYIDISGDGTFRRCPFQVKGEPIGNKTLDEMIKGIVNQSCQFTREFVEDLNES